MGSSFANLQMHYMLIFHSNKIVSALESTLTVSRKVRNVKEIQLLL